MSAAASVFPSLSSVSPTESPAPPFADPQKSSGPSPTLHLLGAGNVGRAFLRQLSGLPIVLRAVSDSTATLFAREGLDARAVAHWKEARGTLRGHPRAAGLPLELALSVADADLVVDCTDSSLEPAARAAAATRTIALLRRGRRVAFAAKTPLLADPRELFADLPVRVGVNAALGGAGRALLLERAELRGSCDALACVPNATTTAVITAIERGATLAEGLEQARSLGLLERDAAQDLDGRDAAVKLAIVAGLLFDETAAPESTGRLDLRALAPELLRWRRLRGATTRLVGRARRDGKQSLSYEEVPLGSFLAVPGSHVVYTYARRDGGTRVHLGDGLGPERTAQALVADVVALLRLEARAGRRAA